MSAPLRSIPIRPVRRKNHDPVFGGYGMGIIFICVGLLMSAVYFHARSEHKKLLDKGIQTEASVVRVISHEHGHGRKSHTANYPVLRFTDAAGKPQLVEMTVSCNDVVSGDTVRIVYNPDNPREMNLATPPNESGLVILSIAGGICALLGLGIIGANLHLSRKKQ